MWYEKATYFLEEAVINIYIPEGENNFPKSSWKLIWDNLFPFTDEIPTHRKIK